MSKNEPTRMQAKLITYGNAPGYRDASITVEIQLTAGSAVSWISRSRPRPLRVCAGNGSAITRWRGTNTGRWTRSPTSNGARRGCLSGRIADSSTERKQP